MYGPDNRMFNHLYRVLEDKFAAAMMISCFGRALLWKYSGILHENDSLSWVCTGKVPKCVVEYNMSGNWSDDPEDEDPIESYCVYIDDAHVVAGVEECMRRSKDTGQLITDCPLKLTTSQLDRVQHIVPLLWSMYDKSKR